MASMKSGKCPGCGEAMQAAAGKVLYACDKCHTTSAKPGKCPKCGEAMEQTLHTFACESCHTSSAKKGKCPKCGKKLVEQFVKMLPSP
jgi:primosomal protein N'